MSVLYFCNPGFFDLRAMLTMGVNTKPHTENPIGRFGTGFKYAVAIILRHKGSIKVHTWDQGTDVTYEFTVQPETIRGDSFEMIKVNGQDAHITTHMGSSWEPWMAFRELYSNMLDENGELLLERPVKAQTIVEVDCPVIWEAYQNRDEYFLKPNLLYTATNDGVEIHAGPSKWYYFRGIAVASTGKQKTQFAYNRTRGVELSEERTARYPHQLSQYAASALQQCEDERVVAVINAGRGFAEEQFDFNQYITPSRAFFQACQQAEEVVGHTYEGKRNSSITAVLKEYRESKFLYEAYAMTAPEFERFRAAKEFLQQRLGIDLGETVINTVTGMDEDRRDLAACHDGEIFIDQTIIQKDKLDIAGALLKCWLNLRDANEKSEVSATQWLIEKVLELAMDKQLEAYT
jgi:hypothetical protein